MTIDFKYLYEDILNILNVLLHQILNLFFIELACFSYNKNFPLLVLYFPLLSNFKENPWC